jgi:hypothetical protein
MKTKRLLILLLICICSSFLFAQKQSVHEKKVYTAPDGRVYIQKSMPVYVLISSKPGSKDSATLLKNSNIPKYSNPMYFDTEGRNTFRHPWMVDTTTWKMSKEEVIFEVYADSHPPISQISFGTAKPLTQNNKLYINGSTEITLVAKDELAGVEKIMVSIDTSEYKEYTSPMVLDKEKEYTFKYYSFDHVGNVEPLHVLTLIIDKTKPKTVYEIKGDHYENTLAGNAQIILKTEDGSSGITKILYKLDDHPEYIYNGPFKVSNLPQGEHKLVFYAVDKVGNTEEQNNLDFYVDKTPPTIIQEIIGKSFMVNGKEFSSGRAQLKLTTIDNKAGVKSVHYSINNGEYQLYDKPVYLSAVNGSMFIKAYAVDNVNNRSQVSEEADASRVPYIDLSGPQLNYNFLGPFFISLDTIYISSKTKIQLKAYDREAGLNNIQYQIDGGELKTYDEPIVIDKESLHTVQYIGTDNVDNTNTGSVKVMVDNTGPVIYYHFSTEPKGVISEQGNTYILYPHHVVLFIAATDAESGYDHMTFSNNGSKEKLFTGYINVLAKRNDITIKAYDKLGNVTVTNLKFGLYQ